MKKYTFIKYESIYDESLIMYALENDPVRKNIDGVPFIEVTTDFKRSVMVRTDSIKNVGLYYKEL